MKSTQRPSKPSKQQSKSHDTNSKPDPTPVADEPMKQLSAEPQLGLTHTVDKPICQVSVQPQTELTLTDSPEDEGNQAIPHPQQDTQQTIKRQKKLDSPRINPRTFEPRSEEPELPPERCQHIKFLDCDKPVSRILFECYHCQQGILSKFTGSPVIGEYKGRPSIIQVKIKCPTCERTAIRLNTGEVLSTTAIPSPWS